MNLKRIGEYRKAADKLGMEYQSIHAPFGGINVGGEAYLEESMSELRNYDNVGFCLDTGHEMCYNRGKDMLALMVIVLLQRI